MDHGQAVAILSAWTADQWGLVTSAQARQESIDTNLLSSLAQGGLLVPVGHDVYQLTGAPTPLHLDIAAAWLALDPAAPAWQRRPSEDRCGVVSHSSACALHQLGDLPVGQVEISVPHPPAVPMPAVRLHPTRVPAGEVTLVDGLPVTTAERTITDLLATGTDGGHIGGVIADAHRSGLIDPGRLASEVAPLAASFGLPRTATGTELLKHLVWQAGQQLER